MIDNLFRHPFTFLRVPEEARPALRDASPFGKLRASLLRKTGRAVTKGKNGKNGKNGNSGKSGKNGKSGKSGKSGKMLDKTRAVRERATEGCVKPNV
jgi:hypothetical protein